MAEPAAPQPQELKQQPHAEPPKEPPPTEKPAKPQAPAEQQAAPPPEPPPIAKWLMSYHWVVVAAVAVLFAWRLFSLLAAPSTASVNDKLSLAVGGVILILVFCFGLVVLIYIAANQIDLSHLLSEPGGGASLSRFQFLIFTFVVALSLFLVVAHGYTFPDIPAGVLTLLGISASTYAVGKGITASDPEHMASKGPRPTTTPPPTKPDTQG